MSTGSLSDAEDLPDVGIMLACGDGGSLKVARRPSPVAPPAAPPACHDEGPAGQRGSPGGQGRGGGGAGKARKKAPPGGKRSPPGGGGGGGAGGPEGKQVQRNAANARERARMRVLSKAFSRLKTTLPWVPPDTKLSKLDTLRLASSYIAHLRQILASDKYENGYIHPVNLIYEVTCRDGDAPVKQSKPIRVYSKTWPFMVAGKPENELKEAVNTTRLCGPTAS